MDSAVEQIKAKINIVEVVGQYVTLKRAGHTYMARCPFHKERTPSFHVSAERGTYKCFGCGEGGDVFTFIQKMDGLDFATVLKQLAEKAGVKLERTFTKSPEQKDKEDHLRDVCEAAVQFFELELKRRTDVQDYIKTRGVHDETVVEWRLGYAPASWDELCKHLQTIGFAKDDIVDAGFAVKSERRPGEIFDRFRGRIIFPIFDPSGRPIAVSGRFFEDLQSEARKAATDQRSEPAKYVNSPETVLFKKSQTLYGFDRARASIRKADCILLVEGQFDLIMSHQSGLPFAVALSGTALTVEHLFLIGRLSKRLVLALDADNAGIRAGLKSALMAITAGFDVKVPTFPAGQDPADVARTNSELLKAAVRTSHTAVEFFLDALRADAKDERAYKKIVELQVLPLIAAMHSTIDQEHFAGLVAHKLHVSPEAVKTEVKKVKTNPRPSGEPEVASLGVHQKAAQSSMSALQKKVGMLLSHFGRESEVGNKLAVLLGEQELDTIAKESADFAEELRFRFDAELGEHTSDETIAGDMLSDITRHVERERLKMKFI